MVNERQFYVYILASGKNGTLYIGVTSDLVGRIYTHRNDLVDGFTRRYGASTTSSISSTMRPLNPPSSARSS